MGLLQLRPDPAEPQGCTSAFQQPGGHEQQQQQQQQQQEQEQVPAGAASEGLDVHAERAWPRERRAQRLSYALLTILLDVSGRSGVELMGLRAMRCSFRLGVMACTCTWCYCVHLVLLHAFGVMACACGRWYLLPSAKKCLDFNKCTSAWKHGHGHESEGEQRATPKTAMALPHAHNMHTSWVQAFVSSMPLDEFDLP